ncbi:hypothetical protein ACNOYE_22040 [Nannocystaceae bacterium ST9]
MRSLPPIALVLALLPACMPGMPGKSGEPQLDPVGEDEFAASAAEAICAQLFACQCGDNQFTPETEPLPWADEAACVAEKQPVFQAILDEALATGGDFSETCAAEYVASLERPECLSAWEYVGGGGKYYDGLLCPIVVTEREVGDPCQSIGYEATITNDCGAGKVCSYQTFACVESGPLPAIENQSCEAGGVDLPCADGLRCSYTNEDGQRCQAELALGDPCPNYTCNSDALYCDYGTMTCQAAGAAGASCESMSCGPGLFCDGGQDFTCVPQFEYGESCASDTVCADDGSCIDNVCVAPSPIACYAV